MWGQATAIYQQRPFEAATRPMISPMPGLSCASCQIGPRALHNLSFRTLGEGTLAPSQGFAGRELEGQRDAEEEETGNRSSRQTGVNRETPRNPSTNQGTSLGDPQMPA